MGTVEKILIVEDEEELAELMAGRLRAAGHEVETNNTCGGSYEKAKEYKPSILILDVMLGDGAGYQIARKIRRDSELNAVPILFASSMSDEQEIKHALEQGGDDYLAKPFTQQQLMQKVAAMQELSRVIAALDPVTKLPGLEALKRKVDKRLLTNVPISLCCVQMNGLPRYREKKGQAEQDKALKLVAKLLVGGIRGLGVRGCYLCHMGGEYFVALLREEDYARFADDLIANFNLSVKGLLTEAERLREDMISTGTAEAGHRSVRLSLLISVVHTGRRKFSSARQMLQVLEETHRVTAGSGKSVVFVDRKRDFLS